MGLIILSGPPCSGKTSFLTTFSDYKIVSSDKEIEILGNKKYSQNQLNIIGVENSYSKINELILSKEKKIIYDSTNITIARRKDIFKNINTKDISVINFVSDFNNIYDNRKSRGKNLKIEIVLYLFIIYQKSSLSEGFIGSRDIFNIQKNNFEYLLAFLEGKKFNKKKLLEENKELKILNELWIKGGKDYFLEYKTKLNYLEDMTLEDKLALFYGDIKYFYVDFVDKLNLTYRVDYEDFLDGFINNILIYKIEGLGLDKVKVISGFHKLIRMF